jgi:DNA-directed RNA polymerase subunit alpha
MVTKSLLKGFKRPSKIEFQHDELNVSFGRFIAEPFERGYGITIGNSLRRVLLSSIDGVAITAVKIEGIQHEFSTLPGVYEDVTRILLNLKKICFKYDGEIHKVLHVVKEGPGQLTGADFNIDSEIVVLNPNVVIANLDTDGKIDIEIQVERGRGYTPAEISKNSIDVIGVIAIDAVFSPVKKVNISVVDTRVGQRTDYDKLILEITTDGSIKPDDALAKAAKIIKDHMTLFINFEEEIESSVEVVDEGNEKLRAQLSKSIDDLELSVRAYNMLKSLDVHTIENLIRKTEDELRKSKHFSDLVLREVKSKLEVMHLSLGLKD